MQTLHEKPISYGTSLIVIWDCAPWPQGLESQRAKPPPAGEVVAEIGVATQRSPVQSPEPKSTPQIRSGPKKKQRFDDPADSPFKPKDLFGAGQFPKSPIVQAFQ